METNPIYASSGCPNNMDNSKQIRPQICINLHISNRICFERETPNRVTRTMNRIRKQSLVHVLTYGLDGRCCSTTACGQVNESTTVNQPPLSTKEKRVSNQCQQKKSSTGRKKSTCFAFAFGHRNFALQLFLLSTTTLEKLFIFLQLSSCDLQSRHLLLIFCCSLKKSCCVVAFQGKPYLWGVFRRRSCKSKAASQVKQKVSTSHAAKRKDQCHGFYITLQYIISLK